MRRLRLDRPIAFLDLESTGPNPKVDRIVEVAVVVVRPDGTREAFETLVDPGVPIPPAATRVHGISDADVRGAPSFARVAGRLVALLADADIGGFGVRRFDIALLEKEFERAGVRWKRGDRRIVDALVIFHRKEPRDLTAAYKFFCGKDLAGAHSALADVEATIEIIDGQLRRYPDLPDDVAGLHAFCETRRDPYAIDAESKIVWRGDEAALNIGRHRGATLKELAAKNPDYLRWMVEEGDFSDEVKEIAREALAGRFPAKS